MDSTPLDSPTKMSPHTFENTPMAPWRDRLVPAASLALGNLVPAGAPPVTEQIIKMSDAKKKRHHPNYHYLPASRSCRCS